MASSVRVSEDTGMLYVVILGTLLFLIFPTHLRVLHDEAELRVRERYWGLVLVSLL